MRDVRKKIVQHSLLFKEKAKIRIASPQASELPHVCAIQPLRDDTAGNALPAACEGVSTTRISRYSIELQQGP